MVVTILLGLLTGLPLAFVLGSIAVAFSLALWGPSSLYGLFSAGTSQLRNYVLIAVPLFILMAMILFRSGIAEDMYEAVHKWSGRLRGGLAMATVVVCTLFAAVSGILSGSVVSMGLIALPNMFRHKYSKDIALGSILGGAALGPLIPPSVAAIIYGIMAGTSIGGLFAGGIITGIIISFMFVVYIGVRSYIQKGLCPALPEEEIPSLAEKVRSLRHLVFPVLLILLVLGVIFTGVATPTEASAVGVLGALIAAVVRRRLSFAMLKDCLTTCMSLTSMIIWIMIGATAFTSVFLGSGGMRMMESFVALIPGGPMGTVIACMLIVFVLGMFIDTTAIIMITAALFAPIVAALGVDKLWFGIIYMVNVLMGAFTPPFGFCIFILKGVAPPDVTLTDIYKASLPFIGVQLLALVIFIAFPSAIMWFPRLLMAR
jgi:tripartite ATP-independent transporter DctM subunit